MKRIKKTEERRIRISISIDPILHKILESQTNNKSKYIEDCLIEYFKKQKLYDPR